jgi:lactam utilization protein B
MKKNLTLSLNAGYSYKDNRSFGFKKMGSNEQFSSMITYQKGNITYVLPYKNKALIHRFKTPQKPNN